MAKNLGLIFMKIRKKVGIEILRRFPAVCEIDTFIYRLSTDRSLARFLFWTIRKLQNLRALMQNSLSRTAYNLGGSRASSLSTMNKRWIHARLVYYRNTETRKKAGPPAGFFMPRLRPKTNKKRLAIANGKRWGRGDWRKRGGKYITSCLCNYHRTEVYPFRDEVTCRASTGVTSYRGRKICPEFKRYMRPFKISFTEII